MENGTDKRAAIRTLDDEINKLALQLETAKLFLGEIFDDYFTLTDPHTREGIARLTYDYQRTTIKAQAALDYICAARAIVQELEQGSTDTRRARFIEKVTETFEKHGFDDIEFVQEIARIVADEIESQGNISELVQQLEKAQVPALETVTSILHSTADAYAKQE